MPTADNYKIVVTLITGSVYIAKFSKKNAQLMTDDRRKVPPQEFLEAVIMYTDHRLKDEKSNIMSITIDGIAVAEVKLLRDNLKKVSKK